MVRTLTKPLVLSASLVVAAGIGVLSWWAWRGFEDTLRTETLQIQRVENLAAFHVVHNLGAELFHLNFTFRLEISKALRDGEVDWPRRLEAILATYRSQAHYPALLQDVFFVSQEPSQPPVWWRHDDRGWTPGVQPPWVPPGRAIDPPSDPIINFENPVWLINLPARSGAVRAVVLHYDVDLVLHSIVPDLAKKALGASPGRWEFSFGVSRSPSPESSGADLRVPLVPPVPFSAWLQTYLGRSPGRFDDPDDLTLASPSVGEPLWRLEVRLLPRGLAAHTIATRGQNLLAAGTLMVVLFGAVVLILWFVVRLLRVGEQERAFTALVSHELKTPVAAIRSLSENLAEGLVSEPSKVKEYGRLIDEQTHRLGKLITNILTLAALDAPGTTLANDQFDANLLLQEVGAPWNLPLHADLGPWIVRGNRPAIRAALDNLATNALRYGVREGQAPEVTLGLIRVRRGPVSWVGLSVSDRGPGLSRSEFRRLFRPYRRGDLAHRHQIPGGGIGLSLVKATMTHVGGRFEVTPVPNGGLCCILWLREGGQIE